MKLSVGRFVLDFEDIRHKLFEGEHYRGVTFFAADGFRYEVIESRLGTRLLINHQTEYGHMRDVPFHEGTFRMLPRSIHTYRKA